MKTSLLSLFAGTVFLAGAAGASAGEPVTLAAAELDSVTAGAIDQSVTGISQANISWISQYASADAQAYYGDANASASNYASVYQSNTNYGNVDQDVSQRARIN